MTTKQAEKILKQFNRWRREDDKDTPQPDPKDIGLAIDKAINILSRFATTRPTKKPKL